jgi:hypothetical protein
LMQHLIRELSTVFPPFESFCTTKPRVPTRHRTVRTALVASALSVQFATAGMKSLPRFRREGRRQSVVRIQHFRMPSPGFRGLNLNVHTSKGGTSQNAAGFCL